MAAPLAQRSKNTSPPNFSRFLLRSSHWNAQKRAASRDKPPRKIGRTRDSNACAGLKAWQSGRGEKSRDRIGEEVPSMESSINRQRLRQFAWTGAEILDLRHISAAGHFLDTLCRLQGTNQIKAILGTSLHQKVQEPVHPVVQIDISSPRRHASDKFSRGWPGKSVTGLIVQNGIRLSLNNNPATTTPNQLTSNHFPCTGHGIAFKKITLEVHQAEGKSLPKPINF